MNIKKFFVIILMLAFTVFTAGCGQNKTDDSIIEYDTGERPEYVLDGISLSNQIECFMEDMDAWIIESEFEIPQYTVTDLDKNGRIELISAINQGTGLYTTFHVYEINENEDGFSEVTYNFDTEESLPDIAVMEGTAYYNAGTDEWIYIVSDTIRNGASENWTVTGTMELLNGELTIDNLGTRHTVSDSGGNEKNDFYDYSGDEISEDEFNDIADTVYGTICDKYYITYAWFATTDGQNYMSEDVIEGTMNASYELFIFSDMEETELTE